MSYKTGVSTEKKIMEKNISSRPLVLFLLVTFGVCWGIALLFIVFGKFLVPIIGPLTLTHPLAILALYSPSIAGLLVYYVYGGWSDVGRVASKILPKRKHIFWYLSIFSVFIVFVLFMRYGSLFFNQKVPDISLSVPEMIMKALWNLIGETGLIGGIFGWIGFLLPYLQKRIKSTVVAALLTGLTFGLWVLPGYMISSVNPTNTLYLLYVLQLMVFIVFAGLIFNLTEGNLLLYVFAFWLAATGSHIQLYYFTPVTQLMEIAFFFIASIVMAIIINLAKLKSVAQTYPEFIYRA